MSQNTNWCIKACLLWRTRTAKIKIISVKLTKYNTNNTYRQLLELLNFSDMYRLRFVFASTYLFMFLFFIFHSPPLNILVFLSHVFIDIFLNFGSFCPLYVSHPPGERNQNRTQRIQLAKSNSLIEKKKMFGGLWIQILSGNNFTPADLKWTTQLTTFHLHTLPFFTVINPIIIIPTHFLTFFHSQFLFLLQPVAPPLLSTTTLFKVVRKVLLCYHRVLSILSHIKGHFMQKHLQTWFLCYS